MFLLLMVYFLSDFPIKNPLNISHGFNCTGQNQSRQVIWFGINRLINPENAF